VANDTIVAIATAQGESAVALVRLSGPDALRIAARHFRGSRSPQTSPGHRILHGVFVAGDGTPIDEVLLSVFRAPRSYTGEDAAEISSHGGATIPRMILETLVAAGARPARPGEFTERAFRNGKLDLSQAEAVAALVKARSERAARAALATLGGELSRRIASFDDALVSLLAEVEARIDFPTDVLEELDGPALADRATAIAAPIRELLDRLPSARRRETGLRVALVGRPNVGKSSLLNAILGYDRAIVSESPGTTRDTVEESLWIDGAELRLTDTAGWRGSDEPVERLGVERSARAARDADLAVLVLDRSQTPREEDRAAAALVEGRPTLVAWNKADLGSGERPRSPLAAAAALAEVETVAVRPGGAQELIDALRGALPRLLAADTSEELPTASARQEALLRVAWEALDRAERALRHGDPHDLIAADLTEARMSFGEMVGRGVDDRLIEALFRQFCVGK
jgi:tRNA modification GTPase